MAAPYCPLQGKREGTPTPDDEQRMMQQMRAEGLMATPAAAAAAEAGAGPSAAGTPAAGAGGPPPKDGPGTKRIRREVFVKSTDGSWQARTVCCRVLVCCGCSVPVSCIGRGAHPSGIVCHADIPCQACQACRACQNYAFLAKVHAVQPSARSVGCAGLPCPNAEVA
jgi:hypothetical protein